MSLSEKRRGELYIFFEVFLWGFFPVITVLSYAVLPSVLSFLWSSVFAALFFAGMLTYRKRWHEVKNPIVWKYSAIIALCIGVLFYGLYFLGLQTTTPSNAAIIALFEVFTTFIFFSVLGRAAPSREHSAGAILMVVGAIVVLAQNFSGFHAGDFLILAGTFFTPAGNYFQQKARRIASSETIMFLRSVLSIPFVVLFSYAVHVNVIAVDIRPVLVFLLINGVVLLGFSKMLWIEAIHRIPVPKATALQALSPLWTILFAWVFLFQVPTWWQLASLVPFGLGVLFLTDQISLRQGKDAKLA